jgi:hypothetical protein
VRSTLPPKCGLQDANKSRTLIFWAPSDDEPFTPEQKRRKELTQEDPVHKVRVQDFVKEHLEQVQASCGGQETFSREWLENVDKDVLAEFGKLGVV